MAQRRSQLHPGRPGAAWRDRRGLAQPQPGHVFIATSSGATWIYASSNGGQTWQTVLTLLDGGAGLTDFGFTTATQGVAVEGRPDIGSHLYMTRDSGRSWSRARFLLHDRKSIAR